MGKRIKKIFGFLIIMMIIVLSLACGKTEESASETVAAMGEDGEFCWEFDEGSTTKRVDSSTFLTDGIYQPDDFSWSGGTGRVELICDTVEVKNGHAWAVIGLSSMYYDYVKANGSIYYGPKEEDCSMFKIPVALNQNNTIRALTTKMSSGHEIEYTLYIYVKAADQEGTGSKAGDLQNPVNETIVSSAEDKDGPVENNRGEAALIEGLKFERKIPLSYAEQFDIYQYADDYWVIDVHNQAKYLIVPENGQVPEQLESSMIILQQPIDKIYLAATSAMSLFDAIDVLDRIRFSGTAASGWHIAHAADAMNDGKILFAGKYSEPDYELLLGEECRLAVESTMILHVPKVGEMLESLGIPVFIDYSSYETHPLGRTEWVKVYGVLTGKFQAAEIFFEEQASIMTELQNFLPSQKKIAFFYINTNGTAVVRRQDDYIPQMIEMGGGIYAFKNVTNHQEHSTSIEMTLEQFYAEAKDADYIIYNTSIDTSVKSLDDLLAKSALLKDFKAVSEDHVWCSGSDMYQSTDRVSQFIRDVHLMLTEGEEESMTFLKRLRKRSQSGEENDR